MNKAQEKIMEMMEDLSTNGDRKEVIDQFCLVCGSMNPKCKCWE
jgi:hypothetical protein